MSIATLKKKTSYKYNNSSVGHTQFSLNGGHRNQGYIGQTSLSRSVVKTPMKGIVARGHGGHNGLYPQRNILPSDITSLNDPTKVKPSVVSSNGMIKQRYRWIKRPLPFSVFKPKKMDECKFDIVKDKIINSCYKIVIQNVNKATLQQNIPIVNCKTNIGNQFIDLKCKTNIGTTSIGTKLTNGVSCN